MEGGADHTNLKLLHRGDQVILTENSEDRCCQVERNDDTWLEKYQMIKVEKKVSYFLMGGRGGWEGDPRGQNDFPRIAQNGGQNLKCLFKDTFLFFYLKGLPYRKKTAWERFVGWKDWTKNFSL